MAIVHAHEGMRFGIRTWLEQAGVAQVVLEQSCPKGLLSALPTAGVQVLLLHVGVALQLALDTALAVRRHHAGTGLLLVGEWTETMLGRAAEVDPHGLLYPAVPLAELEQAVRVAAQGGLHANALMRGRMRPRRREAARPAGPIAITAAQERVLRLICRADQPTYARIAAELQCGLRTVHTHRNELFKRFGVNTRGKLKDKALASGML